MVSFLPACILATAALLAASLAAPLACAQTPPPPQNAPAIGRMLGSDAPPGLLEMALAAQQRLERLRRDGSASQVFIPSAGRIAAELVRYRTELRITPAQMPCWSAFVDAVQDGAADLRQAIQPAGGTHPSLLLAEFTALRTVVAAGEPLYAALSSDQKAAVERLVAAGVH